MVTARQYVALHLYYVEGWSYRRVGKALGLTSSASPYSLIQRGRDALIRITVDKGANTLPLVEGLLRPSPTSSLTRNVGQAASRREELLDALEHRMVQRDAELADIEECMAGDSFSPTRIKQNHYDQWEIRYLNQHHGEPLPTSAYMHKRRGGGPATYCAAPPTCTIHPRCVGCPHATH